MDNNYTNHVYPVYERGCGRVFLQPFTWSVTFFEISVACVSMATNCLCAFSTYHSRTSLACLQRTILTAISTNYAFLAGMNVVKSTVVLFGTYYPCVTRVTTALCKMQDFPLVFCYILSGVMSLLFGAQTQRRVRYANFSVQQSFIVVVCLVIAMVFTALDESTILRLAKCSVTMAFNERNIGFSFISALIFCHWLAYIVWQLVFLRARNSPKSLEEGLLDMATERVLSAESLAWEISLLLTGVSLLYQHVATKPCAQCTLVALELFFTVLPLCISLAHSMLVLWLVVPVRSTAIRLFPRLGQVIFDPELTAYLGNAVDL